MQTYTLRAIQSMLGISRAVINGLIAAGFVTPARGRRGELRFSFQDVVLLRTAHNLQQAHIPPRKILRSLQRLRTTLPAELPLTGLRISAVGNEVAVQHGAARWQADSGQLLFDFEVRPAAGSVAFLAPSSAAAVESAVDCFDRALALESVDKAAAEAAYRQALEQAPDYLDPYLNLGVMLGEAGRTAEAVALYRQALRHFPDEPLLHFNLAVALEDVGEAAAALACYEACLRRAPQFADAHYNAARLHEAQGQPEQAIRHYSAYRRLQR